MQLNSDFINAVLNTRLSEKFTPTGFSTDSRNIKAGEVFFALSGPNFDAHDYVEQVRHLGASAAIVSRELPVDLPQFVVESPLQALAELSAAWRNTFAIPFLAITGTNGKTTTKEMIASMLESHFGKEQVLKTEGNLNNHIGLPLTLLKLSRAHKACILEMGMSHSGEITHLCNIAKPSISGITNAGPGHLQGLRNINGVAEEKGCIFSGCDEGIAIINKDDPYAEYWTSLVKTKPLYFSLSKPNADIYASNIKSQPENWLTTFDMHYQNEIFTIHLPLLGIHNVANALCAAAMCFAAGINAEAVKSGLANMSSVKGRLKKKVLGNNITLIDDTYNANPASFYAAVKVLESLPASRKILVLGDMKELGENSDTFHAQAGKDLINRIDYLLTVGADSQHTHKAYQGEKLHFTTLEEVTHHLKSFIQSGDTLLFKGSRSMQLEKVIEAL